MGSGQTFGSKMDPRRGKLCDIFRAGGIHAWQCWPRRGNADVQRKIWNAGSDHRRGGLRDPRGGQANQTRVVQSGSPEGLTEGNKVSPATARKVNRRRQAFSFVSFRKNQISL